MSSIARTAVVVATVLAGAFGLSTTASALTPEQVRQLFSSTYNVASVVEIEADRPTYELTIVEDGVVRVLLVTFEQWFVRSLQEDVFSPHQAVPVEPEAVLIEPEDAVTPEAPVHEGETARAGLTEDDCKNGGWEELGFTNQGRCIREHDVSGS
jgi:hypothetical protein